MADDLAMLIAEMKEAPLKQLAEAREGGAQKKKGDSDKKRKSGEDLSIGLKKKKKKTALPRQDDVHGDVSRLLDIKSKPVGDKFIWNHFLVLSEEQETELLRWSAVGRAEADREEAHDGNEVRRLAVQEAVRWRTMSRLANSFHDICGTALGSKWTRHFEKWLYSRRAECETCAAGVFPLGKGVERDEELCRKLIASGMKQKQAERGCEQVGLNAKKAASSIARTAVSVGKNSKVKVQSIAMKEGDREREKIVLTCSGVSMEVNADHYAKLKALAERSRRAHLALPSAAPPLVDPANPSSLHSAVFALLARYASFQGGHYKAGGFQAAIHGECFDVLQEEFGCWLECFASPMNCRYGRFCSAHAETDAPFGSLGSFFDFHPRYGSFEANPPFDDGTIQRMVAHMETLFRNTSLPLSFIVIVPYLPSQVAWMALNASRYNKKRLHLPQAEHGYFEGSQHDRINRYRVAPFDTSVFFLRNEAAHVRWPLAPDSLARLQNAFRPKLHLNPHGLQYAPERDADSDEAEQPAGSGAARAAASAAAAAAARAEAEAKAGGRGGGGGGEGAERLQKKLALKAKRDQLAGTGTVKPKKLKPGSEAANLNLKAGKAAGNLKPGSERAAGSVSKQQADRASGFTPVAAPRGEAWVTKDRVRDRDSERTGPGKVPGNLKANGGEGRKSRPAMSRMAEQRAGGSGSGRPAGRGKR